MCNCFEVKGPIFTLKIIPTNSLRTIPSNDHIFKIPLQNQCYIIVFMATT